MPSREPINDIAEAIRAISGRESRKHLGPQRDEIAQVVDTSPLTVQLPNGDEIDEEHLTLLADPNLLGVGDEVLLVAIDGRFVVVNSIGGGAAARVPTVSALPSSPYDGQEIFFQTSGMATAGVRWRLVFCAASASAYKWECVGGSPLQAQVDPSESTTSGTYTITGFTPGPDVTLPLAGDYDVEIGARIISSTGGSDSWMSYDIGGTGAVDTDGINSRQPDITPGSSNMRVHESRARRKTGLSAVTLASKYKTGAGGGCSFGARYMTAMPVRVG